VRAARSDAPGTRATARAQTGKVSLQWPGGASGKRVIEARNLVTPWRAHAGPRIFDHHPARRPRRPRRPERRRQDHPAPPAARRTAAEFRAKSIRGTNLEIAYFDQHRVALRED
jgi:hypothetical protein